MRKHDLATIFCKLLFGFQKNPDTHAVDVIQEFKVKDDDIQLFEFFKITRTDFKTFRSCMRARRKVLRKRSVHVST